MKLSYYPKLFIQLLLITSLYSCKTKAKRIIIPEYHAPKFPSQTEINASKTLIDQFYNLYQGSFILNENQANDIYVCHNVPVFTDRWGEYWLYSESAMVNLLEEPFEQAVMQIKKHSKDSLDIYFYRIKDKNRFVLGWYDTSKIQSLTSDDLIEYNEGCNGIAYRLDKNTFDLSDKGLCKFEEGFGNHAFSHNSIAISNDGMCFKSAWYDENQNLFTPAPEQCRMFYRDLDYKYYKIVYTQRLKQFLDSKK